MIQNWKERSKENSLAVQLIELKTKFALDIPYNSLTRPITKDKEHIEFHHLTEFFDKQGWYLSVYPTESPKWCGMITDSQNNVVFKDDAIFDHCVSRRHAEAIIASTAVLFFDEQLKQMSKGSLALIHDDKRYDLYSVDLLDFAKDFGMNQINHECFKPGKSEFMAASDLVTYVNGGKMKILKCNNTFPITNMILDYDK